MKKLSIFLVLAIALSLSFQSTVSRKVEWISDTKHDFGILKHKEPGSHYFAFKNISGAPLTVDNVRTSCGCTSTEWESNVVMPDSIGMIKLEYDAEKLGYFQKFARVFFHGQRQGDKLMIEGEVVE